MRRFKSPVVAAMASAAVTAAVVGGVAIAQTSTSVITACVAKSSGNVRIVSSASDCKPNEAATTWNEQGPQGIPGTDGADGVSGWTRVESRSVNVSPGASVYLTARCPQGQKVVGGGYAGSAEKPLGGSWYNLTVIQSQPFPDGTMWEVSAVNDTDRSLELVATAICATVL